MTNEASAIVQKLWNFCEVLRDDGVSYGDYVQQLTNLLFLKMADEQTQPPFNKRSSIPKKYNWTTLVSKKGSELEDHYKALLDKLSKESGLLGVIFRKTQNKIQDPAKLERLIKLIDGDGETGKIVWAGMDIDVKGEIYEGLLEKNAEDVKSGAGQYFTPRPLIDTIVEVVEPKPKQKIGDPACGTGGFFLSAHRYLVENFNMDPDERRFLRNSTFKGWDIVSEVVRLCAMNMYLHGIGSNESQIVLSDSLVADPGDRFDIIMTNPPFGKKSTIMAYAEDGKVERERLSYERDDFYATTSNKQLNFLQHVKTLLKIDGRCAIVAPDNVLFEGGAGETIRKKLLEEFDFHTLLRLPPGIFYAGGVKANVLFFDKKPARMDNYPWTSNLWIYDFRTNQHFTLKENPLTANDLKDFVECYNAKNRSKRKKSERFRPFTYDEISKRDNTNLDIFWLQDQSLKDAENIPVPSEIVPRIQKELQSATKSISKIDLELREQKRQ